MQNTECRILNGGNVTRDFVAPFSVVPIELLMIDSKSRYLRFLAMITGLLLLAWPGRNTAQEPIAQKEPASGPVEASRAAEPGDIREELALVRSKLGSKEGQAEQAREGRVIAFAQVAVAAGLLGSGEDAVVGRARFGQLIWRDDWPDGQIAVAVKLVDLFV